MILDFYAFGSVSVNAAMNSCNESVLIEGKASGSIISDASDGRMIPLGLRNLSRARVDSFDSEFTTASGAFRGLCSCDNLAELEI